MKDEEEIRNTTEPEAREAFLMREMVMKTCWMFPGQGSQKAGMGKEEFEMFPGMVQKADDVLGYSIKELCVDDPRTQLGKTQFTQPALYVVNSLMYLRKQQEMKVTPDYLVGHSLGEYCALFAAGAFDFETGLKLVKERGKMMAEVVGGAMIAVIGLKEEEIRRVLVDNGLSTVDIANDNSPFQIVLSGRQEDILQAQIVCKNAGARVCIPLPVSGAFHSRYMQEPGERFREILANVSFFPLKIPVIANVTACPYALDQVSRLLGDQMAQAVQWTESIRFLLANGVEEFVEVGPGEVLTGLVSRIRRESSQAVAGVAAVEKTGHTGQLSRKPGNLIHIAGEDLGSKAFREDYALRYAYVGGGMYKGVASKEMVIRLGKAGMLGFLGTGGVGLEKMASDIRFIQGELKNGESFGVNLLYNLTNPEMEEQTVDVFLRTGVTKIEAAAFMQMTPALVKYRLTGLHRNTQGKILANHKIMAKVSRPEMATLFLSPAPERIVKSLLQQGKVTSEQAEWSRTIAMADALCVEADSGGHTDQGVAYVLTPAMIRLRDEKMKEHGYARIIHVGAAGGIGTPEAAAAAFTLGADFILTGSIHQCTIESGTSEAVKDILQTLEVQDTAYAPAGDMFEIGSKVQVVKKGIFFPARASKLYELYKQYQSLDEIDEKTRTQIQEKYFKKSFDAVWKECEVYYAKSAPQELEKARQNPKGKMALVFKWYFGYSSDLALSGSRESKVDYQIHSGPSLGAFNQWVKGTELESWRNRHVDVVGKKLMEGTARLLAEQLGRYIQVEKSQRRERGL